MTFYDPDDAYVPKRQSPPRSQLEGMLRDALVNSGGVPVQEAKPAKSREVPSAMMPTADQVALVIVLASRVFGADPIRVASGEGNVNNDYSTSRARAFAAFALEHRFPGLPWRTLARFVGGTETVLHVTRNERRKGRLKWWDEQQFCDLVAKLHDGCRG